MAKLAIAQAIKNKSEDLKYYFVILVIAIFACSLLFIGYPQGQDTVYHISKSVGTEIALKEGQALPMITSNYVNNFGYSWNIFYPAVPNYFMIGVKAITGSYTKALNVLIFLTVFLSGVFMFNLVKKVSGSKNIGLLAAIIYMIAPYRIVDIHIRGALGEVMAFMFLPILLSGLYGIVEEEGKRHYLLCIGAIGLLLSHNISSLLAIIMCGLYVLFNIKKVFKHFKILMIDVLFIVSIVSFFYLPMIQNKTATDYAVFNELKASNNMAHNHSIYFYQLLFGKMQDEWSYGLDVPNSQNADMCFALGLTIIIPLVFTPLVYKNISKERRKLYVLTLGIGLFMMLLTSTIIPWQKIPIQINFIQYSYRFLLIATFLLSIIAAVNIAKIVEKFDLKTVLIYTLIAFIYVTPLYQASTVLKGFDWKEFYEVENIEENQRFSRYCATFEYLPSKAYNNINYIATRPDEPILKEGNASITEFNKDKLKSKFDINENKDGVSIEMPYIYYQGYVAKGKDNQKFKIKESDKGFIQVEIPANYEGIVYVEYKGTALYVAGMVISAIGFIAFVIYVFINEKRLMKENK